MKGLYKSSGYWNTVEARRDWRKLVARAREAGLTECAAKLLEFDETRHGWRTIDKHIAQLRSVTATSANEAQS